MQMLFIVLAVSCSSEAPVVGQNPPTPTPSTLASKPRYTFACTNENLSGTNKGTLRVYRNEIYARLGRQFKSEELQQQFGRTSWYQADPAYSDERLSSEDKDCLALIQKLESTTGFYPLRAPGGVLKPDLDGDGTGESIAYDGMTLTINSKTHPINSKSSHNVFHDGPKGALQLFDLDISDGHRELMVVTDPGVEDELGYLVFGYRDGKIIPMMDAPAWVGNSHFSVLVGAIRHSYDNCGTASTVTWTLKDGRLVKTEKTQKSDSPCAACPYVYTMTERNQRFVGEILVHQNSPKLHREDVLELGLFEANTQLHVRLLELKPETTHLDSISIVVDDIEMLPHPCEKQLHPYCLADSQFATIEQGEALEFTFRVPTTGQVSLKANGYYLPYGGSDKSSASLPQAQQLTGQMMSSSRTTVPTGSPAVP
jgi:hypothetical protein